MDIYFTKKGKKIKDSEWKIPKKWRLTLGFTGAGTPKLVFTDKDGEEKDVVVEATGAGGATVEQGADGGFTVTFHPIDWTVTDKTAHDWHITGATIESAVATRKGKENKDIEVPEGANDCHGELA